MSIQSNKIKFLSQAIDVNEDHIFNATVANVGSLIPNPKMFNEYFGVLRDTHIEFYTVSSKGLFKKIYALGMKTYPVFYKDFKKAEFGKGNGILWLQCVVLKEDFVFTSNWKLESAKKVVEMINKHTAIQDLKLFSSK